jgi:hypothetical protein
MTAAKPAQFGARNMARPANFGRMASARRR